MNTFEKLQKRMAKFVADRDWQEFHNPKNLAMSIAIEAAELMEIFQWMTVEKSKQSVFENSTIREQLKDEIADVLIYSLSLANIADLDLEEVIVSKMTKNQSRFPPN